MLAYRYNTKSPLNGEAAKWVDQNIQRLPLDSVNMHLRIPPPRSAQGTKRAHRASAAPLAAAPPMAQLPAPLRPPLPIPSSRRLMPEFAGARITCPGCWRRSEPSRTGPDPLPTV
jgi:hypothetical protein